MSRRSFKLQPTAEKIWIELDCLGHVTCGSLFWCRGLQTFLSGGHIFVRWPHKLLHNTWRAGHLTWCDCFGMCYIL